jgi:hypothetical protein
MCVAERKTIFDRSAKETRVFLRYVALGNTVLVMTNELHLD